MDKVVAQKIRLLVFTLLAVVLYVGGAGSLSPILARDLAITRNKSLDVVEPKQLSAPAPEATPTPQTTSPPAQSENKSEASAVNQSLSVKANPFSGEKLYVDPNSPAARQVQEWQSTRPADATLLSKISGNSVGIWLGDWYGDIGAATRQWTAQIRAQSALPVFILYNIPIRDCGSYSSGGAPSASAYQSWVQSIANATAAHKAVFVLEPDALAGWDCLSDTQRQQRSDVLRSSIDILSADAKHYIYLDAGNARWHSADVIAARIKQIGTRGLQGVSLNVSNFLSTAESQTYGARISQLTGGLHVVIDTSRNGQGPAANLEWCNPSGRGLGLPPSTQSGKPVDAYLWLKYPGESDGACNGAPASGEWWPDYALGLASRAAF